MSKFLRINADYFEEFVKKNNVIQVTETSEGKSLDIKQGFSRINDIRVIIDNTIETYIFEE